MATPYRCAYSSPGKAVLRRPLEPAQYTSIDFTQTLDDHRVLQSIGSVGDALDNALAESFVDSFKTELIADRVWVSFQSLELAIVKYVGWFNLDRLHQALGDLPKVRVRDAEPLQNPPNRALMKRGTQPTQSPRNPAQLTTTIAAVWASGSKSRGSLAG